jgi:hypothetical protein
MEYIQGEKFVSLGNNFDIFYCHTHEVNNFFKNVKPTVDFVLVSHNSDGKIIKGGEVFPNADVNNMPDNLIKWYGQNVDSVDDRIESIPIGLENSMWFPEIKKIKKITEKRNETKHHKNLVYLNLNIANNRLERQPIYDMLSSTPFVTVEYGRNGLSFDHYLDNLFNHKFMVCPEGNGIDVHQPWEALYVNTIPIQKKNINNRNWRELPICWVDEWDQIKDIDFLNSEYDRIVNGTFNLSKLDFNYWKTKILNKC